MADPVVADDGATAFGFVFLTVETLCRALNLQWKVVESNERKGGRRGALCRVFKLGSLRTWVDESAGTQETMISS